MRAAGALLYDGSGALSFMESNTPSADGPRHVSSLMTARLGHDLRVVLEIMSRCTDEIGQAQPTRAQLAKYWNKPYDATFSVPGLDNSVQPWRIASDGSVTNGNA